ncbi:MAG: helix-turn-helix domain-containing protein [Planctomycetia bacterium]
MARQPRRRVTPPSQAEQMLRLFDEVPDVFLFVKDRQSRFVGANAAWLAMHGCRNLAEVIGKTDADFHPPALAAQYVAEDRQVLKSGRPLRDQSWLVADRAGMPRWYRCTKIPLVDADGRVSGLAGILRPFDRAGNAPAEYRRLTPALEHVITQYGHRITCADLARRAGLSVSQLQREFRRLFNISPGDYILWTRLMMARRRLEETADPIRRIAADCGFYDQAHFTRAFRRHAGMPPQLYRRHHAGRRGSGI